MRVQALGLSSTSAASRRRALPRSRGSRLLASGQASIVSSSSGDEAGGEDFRALPAHACVDPRLSGAGKSCLRSLVTQIARPGLCLSRRLSIIAKPILVPRPCRTAHRGTAEIATSRQQRCTARSTALRTQGRGKRERIQTGYFAFTEAPGCGQSQTRLYSMVRKFLFRHRDDGLITVLRVLLSSIAVPKSKPTQPPMRADHEISAHAPV